MTENEGLPVKSHPPAGPPWSGTWRGHQAMIIGAHALIYSQNPEADRAFLRDALQLPSVNAGGGWMIFGLPPAEVAVHPSDANDVHEFYLMCEDIQALRSALQQRGVVCSPVQTLSWGLLTRVTLPGGGKLGIYEPRHPRPKATRPKRKTRAVAAQAIRSERKAGRPKDRKSHRTKH